MPLYLVIPATNALIGWSTNWLAVQMMFHPVEFVGKRPFPGWQGIIPANAEKMARIFFDLMVGKLITSEELFARLDPKRMIEVLGHRMDDVMEQIISEIMLEKAPSVWEMLPLVVKNKLYREARKDARGLSIEIMEDVKANIDELFDIKQMMIATVLQNKSVLNEFFEEGGKAELRFLIRSGFYFGFLLGIPSMFVWAYYQTWWTLPLGGLIVGYGTNWLAIKLMFEPHEPKRIGPYVLQGLFLKRQQEASAFYARLLTRRLLSAEKISDTILRGPASDKLFQLLERHVNRAIDESAGLFKPYLVLGVGTQVFISLKHQVCDKIMAQAPHSARYVYPYLDEAMDIETTLRTKLQSMSPQAFEGIARPAYQQDEWKLIVLGGILGLVAGWLQYLILT